MECVRDLAGDYTHINTMLDVLEGSVARLNHHRYVDPQMWHGILRFFREFLHGCHQAKVEALILPLIARNGTLEVETTALLRTQGESGRALFEALADLGMPQPDSVSSLDALTTAARRYVDDSRRQLRLERSLVEDSWTRGLSPADDVRLAAEFNRIERDHIGPTGREWYTQLILAYRDIVSSWSHGSTAR